MINVNNLSMLYGARLLFDDVTLNLLKGNRYGLVGANGSGKSTFLKILAGQEEPSLGDVIVPNGLRLGWLKQDHFEFEHQTILYVVMQGQQALWQAFQEKENLLKSNVWNEETGNRLGEIEEIIAHQDGYTAETRAEQILLGLGISEKVHHEPLSILSGGYKLRVLLAQVLFDNPDILLLDEPTNHLDIMSIAWLESYLKTQFKGLLVFISHDQQFLNGLSTHILDVDYGEIRLYHGNYDKFLAEKELVATQQEQELKNTERRIAHLQAFVDRFRAKATKARQAQSRLKQIEKIEIPTIERTSRISPAFRFVGRRTSGKTILSVKDLKKSFGERCLFSKVHFQLRRGDKAVIIGHNGIGKSTLLKTLLGIHEPDCGTVEWGHEVHYAYFAQDHHDQLDNTDTILGWMERQIPQETSQRHRQALGQMLFTGDDVFKKIDTLSGGECARVLFARLMVAEPNFLILDEPTNHLDLESVQGLSQALRAYEGTVLFVSHDRAFVSQTANRVFAFTEKGLVDYPGTYAEYLNKYGDDFLARQFLGK